MSLLEKDLIQIRDRGSDLTVVKQQMSNFESGFPFASVVKPAQLKAGIMPNDPSIIKNYVNKYHTHAKNIKKVKFIPASGAASRMFKDLFAFLDQYQNIDKNDIQISDNQKYKSVRLFFKHLEDFAFYTDLEVAYGSSLKEAIQEKEYIKILRALLEFDGLNYGSLPKALLKFHRYENEITRTPVEEHFVEGANYAKDHECNVYLHFTVSPDHSDSFKKYVTQISPSYQKQYGVKFNTVFSQQKSSTDVIAVDLENKPFRQFDGSLLFRPGGHGALIENLNDIDADLIFIKNIDNVVPDRLKSVTYEYKKALAGLALTCQIRIFNYLKELCEMPSPSLLEKLKVFYADELGLLIPKKFDTLSFDEKVVYFSKKLNRPIRACGMVRNEGEPGGGPFWVLDRGGSHSLQIVESAQIDLRDQAQKQILEQATHFNPVDLVCLVRDYKGEKFDLLKYRDPNTGFIAHKSKDGKELKAQELPGLWNGAMADWNTVFLEVPITTFNPVKSVVDLLKDEHQN